MSATTAPRNRRPKKRTRTLTAEHRPALRKRKFRHDELTAVDLFSGFGGFTNGAKLAGFTAIMAANHNTYKIEVHEANHPEVEHWRADLINEDAADYHSATDLPPANLLLAGVTCTHHTVANSQRAYAEGLSLFNFNDPEFEARVTRSERDRATAICVLQYAAAHHPDLLLIECTTEFQAWGPAIPGKPKIGDGSTYRWWKRELEKLGYRYKEMYLNSMFFGVGQSRDRWFFAAWKTHLPTPDLDHKPIAWCPRCDTTVESRQMWKTGIPASGTVRYGKQYQYGCVSCLTPVVPRFTPSLAALDLSNLGTRIGDKPLKEFKDKETGIVQRLPMAPATMARADRCRQRFADFPAVLMPVKSQRGSEKHPWQPMGTQTSKQETGVLSTGALMAASGNTFERPGSDCRSRGFDEPLWSQTSTNATGVITPPVALAVDNFQGAPRGAGDPLPTQAGSETMALVSSGVLPFRQNTVPATHAEPMPTITSEQNPALLTAAGRVQRNGSIDEAKPLGTVVGSAVTQGAMFSGWFKQNGATGTETAPHPMTDPLGTLTSRDTTALLMAQWRESLAEIPLEDCYFRMMFAHEVGRGCGFDVDFAGHQGSFRVWGSSRDQVDGFGNAVSPQVGEWIAGRLRDVLHRDVAA